MKVKKFINKVWKVIPFSSKCMLVFILGVTLFFKGRGLALGKPKTYLLPSPLPFMRFKPIAVAPLPLPGLPPEQIASGQATLAATDDNTPWGVAKQVGTDSYTMKIGMDTTMATPQEVFVALNNYRKVHSSQPLTWNDTLANYAQSRAELFTSKESLDDHAGFKDYVENQKGYKQLGFYGLGENSSIGYKLQAVHLIEWMYAGDEPHNKNQLDPTWEFVGVGISGNATDLIFGKEKI